MRTTSQSEKRVLKGVVRKRQAAETQCFAEKCHGEPHQACIALRLRSTLTYLVSKVSQWNRKLHPYGKSTDQCIEIMCAMQKVTQVNLNLPCVNTGEPQRVEGATRNTPPTAFH